jgi:hypothetical protein
MKNISKCVEYYVDGEKNNRNLPKFFFKAPGRIKGCNMQMRLAIKFDTITDTSKKSAEFKKIHCRTF